MKFFSIPSIIYLVSVLTLVDAIPAPATEFLEPSSKAMKGILNSKIIPKKLTSNSLESSSFKSSSHELNQQGHMLDPGPVLSNRHKVPIIISQSNRKLELELYLAKLNALKAEAESKTAMVNIDKVNEIWKEIINGKTFRSKNPTSSVLGSTNQRSSMVAAEVKPRPAISARQRTIERKEIIPMHKLELELFFAKLNAKKAEFDLRKTVAKFDKTRNKNFNDEDRSRRFMP